MVMRSSSARGILKHLKRITRQSDSAGREEWRMPRATQYAGGLSHRLPSGKGVSCRDRGSGRGKIFIEELPESVVRQHLVALEVVRVPGHRVAPRCLPQGGEVGVGNSVQPHIFVVEGRIVDADFR